MYSKVIQLHIYNIYVYMYILFQILFHYKLLQDIEYRASLVAQWLRICLLMQGTWVRALAWEDPTCRGATKPVHYNY